MSNLERLKEKIENNELKFLEDNDTFDFGCKMCGKCCTDRNDILLRPDDVFRLAKHTGLKTGEFIKKYCEVFCGSQSKMPLVSLKFREKYFFGKVISVCPFLSKEASTGLYKCGIHAIKPLLCAIYPLGRFSAFTVGKAGVENIKYFLQDDINCPGAQNPKTVTKKEWVDSFNLSEHEEFSLMFSTFLSELNEMLHFDAFFNNPDITDKTKDILFNAYIVGLYASLDIDKDMKSEIERVYSEFKEVIGHMAQLADSAEIKIRRDKNE